MEEHRISENDLEDQIYHKLESEEALFLERGKPSKTRLFITVEEEQSEIEQGFLKV